MNEDNGDYDENYHNGDYDCDDDNDDDDRNTQLARV